MYVARSVCGEKKGEEKAWFALDFIIFLLVDLNGHYIVQNLYRFVILFQCFLDLCSGIYDMRH